MNGKLAKRIRFASQISQQPVAELKRQYRALPYHRRKIAGVKIDGHTAAIQRARWILS